MCQAEKYLELLEDNKVVETDIFSRIDKLAKSEDVFLLKEIVSGTKQKLDSSDAFSFGLVMGIIFENLKSEGQL